MRIFVICFCVIITLIEVNIHKELRDIYEELDYFRRDFWGKR